MTIPMPGFPAPYTVPVFAYQGSDASVDELGNATEAWAEQPVMQSVQGWDILSNEKLGDHVTEERFIAYLIGPPGFWPGIQDRVGLPLPSNGFTAPTSMFNPDGSTAEGIFEVTGHDIENNGFDLWQPGTVTMMKRVEG